MGATRVCAGDGCEESLEGKRRDARYCSPTCRARASRARTGLKVSAGLACALMGAPTPVNEAAPAEGAGEVGEMLQEGAEAARLAPGPEEESPRPSEKALPATPVGIPETPEAESRRRCAWLQCREPIHAPLARFCSSSCERKHAAMAHHARRG